MRVVKRFQTGTQILQKAKASLVQREVAERSEVGGIALPV